MAGSADLLEQLNADETVLRTARAAVLLERRDPFGRCRSDGLDVRHGVEGRVGRRLGARLTRCECAAESVPAVGDGVRSVRCDRGWNPMTLAVRRILEVRNHVFRGVVLLVEPRQVPPPDAFNARD